MIKKSYISWCVFAILAVMLNGCLGDSDYEPEYRAWGNAYTIGDQWYIRTDDDLVMKFDQFDEERFAIGESKRVFIVFNIVEEISQLSSYQYLIKVTQLFNAKLSEIVTANDENRDLLGDGTVYINSGSNYKDNLNLEIVFPKTDGDHVFNLVYDEQLQPETTDKPVVLELRNDKGDATEGTSYISTLYTYDISELASFGEFDEEQKMEFSIIVNRGTVNETKYNFFYVPNPSGN